MDSTETRQKNCTYSYELDSSDRIVNCSDSWDDFATENGGHHLTFEKIKGQSVWDHITDDRTIELYRRIFASARSGIPVQFFLRCDSPSVRRLLNVSVSPTIDGNVRTTTMLFRADPRPPVETLSCRDLDPDHGGCYSLCTWCNKLEDGGWVEVEEVVKRRQVEGLFPSPPVREGICEPCYDRIDLQIREASRT